MRCAILFLLLFPLLASADVFKCKENGHTTYSATPCAAGAVVADYDARRATFTEAFAQGRRIICEDVGVSRTAGGDVKICFVTLKQLNVAGMDFYNVRAHITPTLKGQGLLGQTLLSRMKVTQSGGFMTLSR
jgi:predicted aspartyl protease